MDKKKAFLYLLILSFIGLLFSGYLSFQKFFSNVCPLSSSCTYLFGIPVCYFGFVGFLILFLLSLALYLGKGPEETHIKLMAVLSGFFFLFALVVGFIELPNGPHALLLPQCFYGSLVYLLIFIISYRLYTGK